MLTLSTLSSMGMGMGMKFITVSFSIDNVSIQYNRLKSGLYYKPGVTYESLALIEAGGLYWSFTVSLYTGVRLITRDSVGEVSYPLQQSRQNGGDT